MARTLAQIVAELNQSSQPQIDILKQKQSALPGQLEAENSAIEGRRNRANEDIVLGARRRGLGFSGIPLGEQAQYAADVYSPALLAAQARNKDQELSLAGMLADLYSNNSQRAQSIYQQELDRAEQIRQFNENLAFQRQQAEQARRAAAASSSGGFNLGQTSGTSSSRINQGVGTGIPKGMQQLYNQVFIKGDGSQWDDNSLVSDYNATLKSARYGNARDKQKIALYHSVRPDLFGRNIPGAILANSGSVSF